MNGALKKKEAEMERRHTKTRIKGLKVADVIQLVLTTASTDPILRKSIKPPLPFTMLIVLQYIYLSEVHGEISGDRRMQSSYREFKDSSGGL